MWGSPENAMQNWRGCSDLVRFDQGGGVIKLPDTRDGNEYRIAKLKDDKCWMVDNLRIGGDGVERTLTPKDTDLIDGSYKLPSSSNNCFNQSGIDNGCLYVDYSEYESNGVIGGYYSWLTATAGTGTTSMATGNASGSICPKGWHLPTGGEGGEFEVMAKKYGSGRDFATSNALRGIPAPNFGLYGIYNQGNGNIYSRGGMGDFWSSTSYSTRSAQFLVIFNQGVSSNGVDPAIQDWNNWGKGQGHNVRCVSDQ